MLRRQLPDRGLGQQAADWACDAKAFCAGLGSVRLPRGSGARTSVRLTRRLRGTSSNAKCQRDFQRLARLNPSAGKE